MMKKLLNTIYVITPGRSLSLDGENVVVTESGCELMRLPHHNLEAIVTFGYTGASPALMNACACNNIDLCFLSPNGKFLARVTGAVRGNVLLRKEQYRTADDDVLSNSVAKNFLIGKLYNSKWILERATRDYSMRIDVKNFKQKSEYLSNCMTQIEQNVSDNDTLRGI